LKPGQRLSEVELANALGISRSPVREALQRLANEGLAQLVPNKGAFIATFSLDKIRELYEVRGALEGMVAYLAAARSSSEQVQNITDLLIHTGEEIGDSGARAYPAALDFHAQLAELAGNQELAEIAMEVSTQIQLARSLSASLPGRASIAFDEHQLILEAIAAGDPAVAEQRMREHIHRSMESTVRILSDENGPDSEP